MLRLMSFNIRYGTAPDGRHAWEHRRALAVERMRAFDPDLLGLQECRDDAQAAYIRDALPEYRFIGTRRGGEGEPALEMTPLLIKPSTCTLLADGCFWLSETPDVPGSSSWGAAFPRVVTWARLAHAGREVLWMNVHFDNASWRARNHAAQVVLAQAARIGPGLPMLVSGDFNARKDSPAYRQLTGPGGLQDAHAGLARQGTFHAFGALPWRQPIDWILASRHWQVIEADIDRTVRSGLYPSDHFPVTAVLAVDAGRMGNNDT